MKNKNAEAYNNGTLKDSSKVGVKALNSMTLQVRLSEPLSYFPYSPKAKFERHAGQLHGYG